MSARNLATYAASTQQRLCQKNFLATDVVKWVILVGHVQGCKMRSLMLPRLVHAIIVVKKDILPENAQVLLRQAQGGNPRPMIQPHLVYAIGVVKKDIFPENAQVLLRHVQGGNPRPMIQPHLAYAIGVVKKDIFPENAQILPRKKTRLYTEESDIKTPKKSKHRGGWMTEHPGLFIMGTQLLGSPTQVVMDFREITTGGSLPEI
ncbi:hypothetical protein A2U01_0000967 [Trifolium medium]|uniref:Uncharacterized protein n=1 Tax=Trifolium medium TaxID=97028 RepID=A0A392LYY1_9FABA|nr:hypothetical protein [Trifolium medium]